MPEISIGRRLVRASAVSIPLAMLLYVCGAMAVNAAPAAFPATLPAVMAATGFGSAIAVELSADVHALEEKKE